MIKNVSTQLSHGGILFNCSTGFELSQLSKKLESFFDELQISNFVVVQDISHEKTLFLNIKAAPVLCQITANFDTQNIYKLINNFIDEKTFLLSEIILSMSCCPAPYVFLTFDQFFASVLFRFNTAFSAKKTRIAFDTESAERPLNFWNYSSNNGFLLNENVRLDAALISTIHPPANGQHYTFSCSRACEYVLLLSLALTLKVLDPNLLLNVENLWRKKALMNTDFNDAFLCEHGSYDNPLPATYYVPGDRVWFRNPDEYSSNVAGFEGSWVIYIGSGLFCNFWDYLKPTPLELKCIEVYHWRHGAQINLNGELFMNEPYVASCVESTLSNKKLKKQVISKMMKIRDPSGTYADGGFVDASRDEFRSIHLFNIP